MEPKVLYCDNHLLVLDKPAGVLTQPNQSDSDSLEDFGKRYLKKRFAKPGNVFLEAVHRLDKPVSGVVLFARTSKALPRLHQAQRDGLFEKKYRAVIENKIEPSEGELIDYLVHDEYRARIDPEGKRCCLYYRVIKGQLLEIVLKTGRYHQIRAQLSHCGCPIVGDHKYGSKSKSKNLCLHHYSLSFPHPISKDILCVKSKSTLLGASSEVVFPST